MTIDSSSLSDFSSSYILYNQNVQILTLMSHYYYKMLVMLLVSHRKCDEMCFLWCEYIEAHESCGFHLAAGTIHSVQECKVTQ